MPEREGSTGPPRDLEHRAAAILSTTMAGLMLVGGVVLGGFNFVERLTEATAAAAADRPVDWLTLATAIWLAGLVTWIAVDFGRRLWRYWRSDS